MCFVCTAGQAQPNTTHATKKTRNTETRTYLLGREVGAELGVVRELVEAVLAARREGLAAGQDLCGGGKGGVGLV